MRVRARCAAFLVMAALVLWSCGDGSPAPVAVQPEATAEWLLDGLLKCTPLPADSVTETIGPGGGVLTVGPHRLFVPAGALTAPVAITAVAPSDTVNRVDFSPEGLVFLQDAWLTMSYANCGLLYLPLTRRIAHTTGDLGILEYLVSFDNLFTRRVTGRLEHFSTYAVAW